MRLTMLAEVLAELRSRRSEGLSNSMISLDAVNKLDTYFWQNYHRYFKELQAIRERYNALLKTHERHLHAHLKADALNVVRFHTAVDMGIALALPSDVVYEFLEGLKLEILLL
jgi:hypothetical protein